MDLCKCGEGKAHSVMSHAENSALALMENKFRGSGSPITVTFVDTTTNVRYENMTNDVVGSILKKAVQK